MINQFRVLSAETLDRHGQSADAQAEVRLKATEQLMTRSAKASTSSMPGSPRWRKKRAAMSAELRTQVRYVQQTGETLRRETAALVTALREASDPRLVGERHSSSGSLSWQA